MLSTSLNTSVTFLNLLADKEHVVPVLLALGACAGGFSWGVGQCSQCSGSDCHTETIIISLLMTSQAR